MGKIMLIHKSRKPHICTILMGADTIFQNAFSFQFIYRHTITSKILFVDVLRVINNFLETNPNSYPIIISLENHCSAEYQEVMAEQLLTTFGKKLFIPNEGFDNFTDLPSPRR